LEVTVGSTRERIGSDGRVRYTALFRDLKGRQRSAGTFTTQRQADRAWQRAESRVAQGQLGEPGRGRQTFRDYVEKTWLPNHEIEATTRQSYSYVLQKHILPEFGPMRMIDIMPEHVREWVAGMKRRGVRPPTIRQCFVLLSAVFTTALNDQVTFLHPCKGVKTPPVPAQPRTIITPEQFAALYECLPDEQSRLLVETDVESGLRWGELTELRVRDLDVATRMLTVSRAVVQVHPQFHPDGGRFLVKPYPKDKEYRRFKLSSQITAKLQTYVVGRGLGWDDLLFQMPVKEEPRIRVPRLTADPDAPLGLTNPDAAGHRYRHGTLTGYSMGRCRWAYCRDAYCRYRAERRANGKDDPRGLRAWDTTGTSRRSGFGGPSGSQHCRRRALMVPVRIHDLRHAHASWLLAGGADLQVVKQRLGHGSLRTTEKYLHTLPDADETALEALSKMRNRPSAADG
jgi:integrase